MYTILPGVLCQIRVHSLTFMPTRADKSRAQRLPIPDHTSHNNQSHHNQSPNNQSYDHTMYVLSRVFILYHSHHES